MNTQPKKNNLMNVQYLTQLAILVAVEIVMKLIGLGSAGRSAVHVVFDRADCGGRNRIGTAGKHDSGRCFRFCQLYGCH